MEFKHYDKNKLAEITSKREGESKLGERILTDIKALEHLNTIDANFVLLGVPEDIGPRANHGRAGAKSAWSSFLSKFLNIQENQYLQGADILLLGHLELEDNKSSDLDVLRKNVSEIDEALVKVLIPIFQANKTPILIGGGHNNAYPLLKAYFLAHKQALNLINLDPHADYRPLEGRHSGNPFSYAQAANYLEKYFLVGYHESYNALAHLESFDQNGNYRVSYEDIFVRERVSFVEVLKDYHSKISSRPYGVELDCDSIAHFPSSAQSPSGVNELQARQYLYYMANHQNAKYLHLPEAAPELVEGSVEQVGKLLAYLVSDFCKAKSSS